MVERAEIPNHLGWLLVGRLCEAIDATALRFPFPPLDDRRRAVPRRLAVDLRVDDAGGLLHSCDDRGFRDEGFEASTLTGELRPTSGVSCKTGGADGIVGISSRAVRGPVW